MTTIRRHGRTRWVNVHGTARAHAQDSIDLINSPAIGWTETLRSAAWTVEALIRQARDASQPVRALGSSWALTDIAATRGWLLNTQTLNGRFNVPAELVVDGVDDEMRRLLLVSQCGTTISELNRFLELEPFEGRRRALRTAGIGAGQTLAGAVSGNTHGSAVKVGATPDYVVGIQLVSGTGSPLWLERESEPRMNDAFAAAIGSRLVRDDALFDAAVVSFGAFGVITALAIETDPLYQLEFADSTETDVGAVQARLRTFDANDPPDLHHYEFVFDPYHGDAIEAVGLRRPFVRDVETPKPLWILRGKTGFAPGSGALRFLWYTPLPPSFKAKTQFGTYRENNILGGVTGTPGQLFTATITYTEGMTETSFAVPVGDAAETVDVVTSVVKSMGMPVIGQVRMVRRTRTLLGFTRHAPQSVIFEFGLAQDSSHAKFEGRLVEACRSAGIPLTFHWSKNAGLTPELVRETYGDERVDAWLAARREVFDGDPQLMDLFANDHLRRSGLAG